MRFVFKTSYNQDIQIFRDKVDFGWYAALALLAVYPQGLLGQRVRKRV